YYSNVSANLTSSSSDHNKGNPRINKTDLLASRRYGTYNLNWHDYDKLGFKNLQGDSISNPPFFSSSRISHIPPPSPSHHHHHSLASYPSSLYPSHSHPSYSFHSSTHSTHSTHLSTHLPTRYQSKISLKNKNKPKVVPSKNKIDQSKK
ncbi:13272_t:CDS:1, partial [Dentiscutata erythropus]